MKYDILFFISGPKVGIENNIFTSINNAIKIRFPEIKAQAASHKNVHDIFKIFNSKTIVVHSPLITSFLIIVLARLFGKRVIAFVWDIYPVIISSERFDIRLNRRLYDLIENLALKLCHKHIIPTKDFDNLPQVKRPVVLSFWSAIETPSNIEAVEPRLDETCELEIVFAGQINATRGLEEAVARLSQIATPHGFKLFIASRDAIPKVLENDRRVKYLGFVEPFELVERFKNCDFGLISLSQGFEGPGFPSKTFEYISAHLPCIYFGPKLIAFVDILESSGIGIDIGKTEKLTIGMSKQIRTNFSSKLRRFEKMACFNDCELQKFVDVLHLDKISSFHFLRRLRMWYWKLK